MTADRDSELANLRRENSHLRSHLTLLSRMDRRVASTLDLDAVLQEVVEAACELTSARHGVLALLDDAGQMQRFFTHGLTEEERQRLTDPSQGLGLPGGMKTFLAAPVQDQGQALAHLYLVQKAGGAEFSPEDEDLLALFADQVAVAIRNGRLFAREQAARAQAEEARRTIAASEARLQAILDNTTAIIFVKDLQGRYLLINRRYEALRGVKREELLGKTAYDIMPKAEADASWAHDSQVIESRIPMEWEEQFVRSGVLHTYVSLRFPLWDSDGELYGIGGILTDISERKRAELELTAELQGLRTLVETSPVGVLVAEADGERIVTVNREAERILGFAHRPGWGMQQYEAAFVRRRPDGRAYAGEELPIRRALHQGETVRSEEVLYEFPDGRNLRILVNATPIYADDGRITAAVAVIQDLTPLQTPLTPPGPAGEAPANAIELELAGRIVRLEYGLISERGEGREANEDSVYCEPPGSARVQDDGWLCAVADGMGGAAAGEVASRLAVETLVGSYYASLGGPRDLADAARQANGVVYETAQQNRRYGGMGTTLTAAVIRGNRLAVAHVGDTRAYLLRDGAIRQLTNDHSWVAELVRAGALAPEQARNLPISNILTRVLGREAAVEVDLVEEELQPGDTLVLCSDGISKKVDDREIARAVAAEPPQQAARSLVSLARQRGDDDATVAIITLALRPQS